MDGNFGYISSEVIFLIHEQLIRKWTIIFEEENKKRRLEGMGRKNAKYLEHFTHFLQ